MKSCPRVPLGDWLNLIIWRLETLIHSQEVNNMSFSSVCLFCFFFCCADVHSFITRSSKRSQQDDLAGSIVRNTLSKRSKKCKKDHQKNKFSWLPASPPPPTIQFSGKDLCYKLFLGNQSSSYSPDSLWNLVAATR